MIITKNGDLLLWLKNCIVKFSTMINYKYQFAPKVMAPIISTETTTDKRCIIKPLDRTSFQLPNIIIPYSRHYWLCIFASDEQDPACCTHKNMHQLRQSTFSQLQ
jgi:hypothetical protein